MAAPQFSSELADRIIKRLHERVPNLGVCPVCTIGPWTLAPGYLAIPIGDNPRNILSPSTYPAVALICQHCGYTAIFNLVVLGLDDLVPSPATGEGDASAD